MSDEPGLAASTGRAEAQPATRPEGVSGNGWRGDRHAAATGDPATTGDGALDRVAELIRRHPAVLVAAVAAGFLLGRLAKRAATRRA